VYDEKYERLIGLFTVLQTTYLFLNQLLLVAFASLATLEPAALLADPFAKLLLLLDASTMSGKMVFVRAAASLNALPFSKSTFTSTSFVSLL